MNKRRGPWVWFLGCPPPRACALTPRGERVYTHFVSSIYCLARPFDPVQKDGSRRCAPPTEPQTLRALATAHGGLLFGGAVNAAWFDPNEAEYAEIVKTEYNTVRISTRLS